MDAFLFKEALTVPGDLHKNEPSLGCNSVSDAHIVTDL